MSFDRIRYAEHLLTEARRARPRAADRLVREAMANMTLAKLQGAPVLEPTPPEPPATRELPRSMYDRLVHWSSPGFPEPNPAKREYGVFAAVSTTLYDYIWADEELMPKFELARKRRADATGREYTEGMLRQYLEQHMSRFLIFATGGPVRYQLDDLYQYHKDLALNNGHFDRVLGHAGRALTDCKVPPPWIRELADTVETTRPYVVTA